LRRAAPVWLAREQPEEPASLPELASQRGPDALPHGREQHSASERSLPDVVPVAVLRGSAECALGLPGVPREQDVLQEQDEPQEPGVPQGRDVQRGGPVQLGQAQSAPEAPRWGAPPEHQVLRARVRLGGPPTERVGRPAERSACCGRQGKPPDARRGRP
jgi:hypothetical protein